MDKARQEEIIRKLEEKGAKLPCPRCGNGSFTIVDGYFNQTLQNELTGLIIGGPSVPSIVTVCSRCGFLAQHALGALESLPQPKEQQQAAPASLKKA
jgi:ribosomal protein S27AE